MVFTSPIFLFYFLPLVLAGYYALPRSQRNTFLALSSYVFYGWWNPWYVFLMLGSTVVDWFCGIAITREGATEGQRRAGVELLAQLHLAVEQAVDCRNMSAVGNYAVGSCGNLPQCRRGPTRATVKRATKEQRQAQCNHK